MQTHRHNWKNPILKSWFQDAIIILVRDCECGATILIDDTEAHMKGNGMDYSKTSTKAQRRMLATAIAEARAA